MSTFSRCTLAFIIMGCLSGTAVCTPQEADKSQLPQSYINSLGMKMIRIPAGSYIMGDPRYDNMHEGAKGVYGPQHPVTLSSDFYMASTEVIKGDFRKFVAETGKGKDLPELHQEYDPNSKYRDSYSIKRAYSRAPGDEYSMYFVDWDTAVEFCKWLSSKEGRSYRLPSEAEWEHACRAETQTKYWWGDNWKECMVVYREVGYFIIRYPFPQIAIPGTFPANPWGLYEISGNAYEWTLDWYDPKYYFNSPGLDPKGPKRGKEKIMRGGWLGTQGLGVQCTFRFFEDPKFTFGGIRLVCEIDKAFLTNVPREYTQEAEGSPIPPKVKVQPGLKYQEVELATDVKLRMVSIPQGKFLMGSDVNKKMGKEGLHEFPQTPVELTKCFYIGVYEITQQQFEAVLGFNPSEFKSPKQPVENISYNESLAFCKKLTDLHRKVGAIPKDATYRLPTEAEWEYTCRAGTDTRYYYGDSEKDLHWFAWYDVIGGPHEVGSKLPNAWGLYDMHGNVWEWCEDHHWKYPGDRVSNPRHKRPQGVGRMARGGGWCFVGHRCRTAARSPLHWATNYGMPDPYDISGGYNFCGFRVVRTLGAAEAATLNQSTKPE
jgi:formylglycine-generating enzyme required for sulfatase activity